MYLNFFHLRQGATLCGFAHLRSFKTSVECFFCSAAANDLMCASLNTILKHTMISAYADSTAKNNTASI